MIKRLGNQNPRVAESKAVIQQAKTETGKFPSGVDGIKSVLALKKYCKLLENRIGALEYLLRVGEE